VAACIACPIHRPDRRPRPTAARRHSPLPQITIHGPVSAESLTTKSTTESSELLLKRYRELRQPEDFRTLVERHSGELLGYLVKLTHDTQLAEDVLQDTLLQVHTRIALYRDGWPASPWLYSIAHNRAIDTLRRAQRMPRKRLEAPLPGEEETTLLDQLSNNQPDPLDILQHEERRAWLRESIHKLPDALRKTLEMAYEEHMPYAQIAELLGIPFGTVKSRLHVAIDRLRTLADRENRIIIPPIEEKRHGKSRPLPKVEGCDPGVIRSIPPGIS